MIGKLKSSVELFVKIGTIAFKKISESRSKKEAKNFTIQWNVLLNMINQEIRDGIELEERILGNIKSKTKNNLKKQVFRKALGINTIFLAMLEIIAALIGINTEILKLIQEDLVKMKEVLNNEKEWEECVAQVQVIKKEFISGLSA